MTNKGIELSISSKNLVREFKWSTDFNISHNKNRLESLVFKQVYYDARVTDILSDFAVKNMPGRSLGGFWGYESEGVDPETGELMYVDKNDDGTGTMARSRKKSFAWYQQVISSNGEKL